MCVSLVWRAVGSPASVSNPSPRLREVAVALAKGLGQPPQPPGLLDRLYAAVELQREPSGVITPVLELPQTLHEDLYGRERRFVPGVAAEICRRPDDRPRAETHPPNASMNVCLVNSGS